MRIVTFVLVVAASGVSLPSAADVVLDVHALGLRTARAAGIPAAVASNTMVVAAVAMFDAANAVEGGRFRAYRAQAAPPAGADADAAALGAGCAVLAAGFAAQAQAISAACDTLAAAMPATESARAGRAFGEVSGKDSIAARQREAKPVPNSYRPRTAAGVYVATPLPIGFDLANSAPWAMTSPQQFRPGPPPSLDSDLWVRDFVEVKTMGARNSTARSAEQTATAWFWASNGPQQFMESVPNLGFTGTTCASRARLLALYYLAMADAAIAVFDAKNAYDFWRPITAIRNADEDGNPRTERDPAWVPLIDTPLHQEYPCAHCTLAAAIVTALALSGAAPLDVAVRPADASSGASARTWTTGDAMLAEVGNARVWSGVHYRHSTEAGIALGRNVGARVAQTQLVPVP